jgi:hypothetical protein
MSVMTWKTMLLLPGGHCNNTNCVILMIKRFRSLLLDPSESCHVFVCCYSGIRDHSTGITPDAGVLRKSVAIPA